jgi:hypothetical protein
LCFGVALPSWGRSSLGCSREGMLDGCPPGRCLLLMDYTSRLRRQPKARVGREVTSILGQLGTTADLRAHRINRLFAQTRLLGSYFTTDRERLSQLARHRGVHHLDNLASSPA